MFWIYFPGQCVVLLNTNPFIQSLVQYDLNWLSTIKMLNSENPYNTNSFLQYIRFLNLDCVIMIGLNFVTLFYCDEFLDC